MVIFRSVQFHPGLTYILISDIRALWRSGLSARVPECHKLKMQVRPGWQTVTSSPLCHFKRLNRCDKFQHTIVASKQTDSRRSIANASSGVCLYEESVVGKRL